ncbi:MAG: ATP-binding protein [Thermodesulfobacteriota bacterium]
MGTSPEVKLLIDAFDTFKKASTTLESSYKELEERIAALDLELQEKNNFLSGILDGLPIGVLVTGEDGIVHTVNDTASVILDKEGPELIGRAFFDLVTLTSHAISGAEIEVDIQTGAGDGVEKKTITVNSTRLKTLKGEGSGELIVIKDVSEIKRMRESAARDKRLKAMGEMAASIAHQIRNPLGSIELFASLLTEELKADKENSAHAGEIINAVRSLNNTVSNMLLFANTSKPVKKRVTTSELAIEIAKVCKFLSLDKQVTVVPSSTAATEFIEIDTELIKQAILNLIINGVEAAADHAEARVTVSLSSSADIFHIAVVDNGEGINNGDGDRLFDPFFTTKPRGTGLGLTVVSNIVKSHDGFVDVDKATGGGTIFSVALPVSDYSPEDVSGDETDE